MGWKPDSSLIVDGSAVTLLQQTLAAATGCQTASIVDADLDWNAIEQAAAAGKLTILVEQGLRRMGAAIPATFLAAVQRQRQRNMALNAGNLSTLGRLVPKLVESRLPFVVFKGPLRLHALYGDYFLRPSTDIDILVSRRDFSRASELLIEAGYKLPDECATPWWLHFLGEQHFFSPHQNNATVDLHHRVQQPGSPSPRGLADYIADHDLFALGQAKVPTLTMANATLLSCISLTKAMIRNEAAGAYLCDFVVAVRAMTPDQRADLVTLATRQGLLQTLRLTLRAAERVLGFEGLPGLPEVTGQSCFDKADLARLILTPWAPEARLPRRRQILWELCDASGPGGRAGTYVAEALNQMAGNACRRWYHPPSSEPARMALA